MTAGSRTIELRRTSTNIGAVNVDNATVFSGSGPAPTTTTVAPTTTTTAPTTTTAAPTTTTTTAPPGSQVAYVELEDTPNNLTFEPASALGGTGRGSLGYWFNVGGYSRFSVSVSPGAHIVRVRYACPASGTRGVFVDGVQVATVSLPATGGWGAGNSWRTVDIPLTLAGGTRSIEFRRTASDVNAVNVDNATVFTA